MVVDLLFLDILTRNKKVYYMYMAMVISVYLCYKSVGGGECKVKRAFLKKEMLERIF